MPILSPRVFTIPPSAPFLPALVRALVAGDLIPGYAPAGDALALATATLYLPTRRACRLARDVFLDVLGGQAAVLPRILPIGDIDEDELIFAEAATGPLAAEALALPRALGGMERRLLLTQLIRAWAERIRPDRGAPLVAATPAASLALADDLARLIDDMVTRQVDWKRLDDLVPDRFDRYWQLTLDFLKIARDAWPALLDEGGAIEPAERRDRLIDAEAKRLRHHTDGPVIAAGSTGSMPATAKLLETIAHLPNGAVVLPGLDRDLNDDAWTLITGKRGKDEISPAIGHPQFAMQALLARIGISRHEVESLASPAAHRREKLVSQALCPAAACECWQTRLPEDTVAAALADVAVIEAANAEDEALAIAVALREALAQDKTAALVTPDRALARRVVAALARWNVAVEDSGGNALIDTPAGRFARLAANAALGGVAPVTLLALAKHPQFRLGTGDVGQAVAVIERALLRGPRPKPGTAGLRHALTTFRATQDKLHPSDPRRRITPAALDAADAMIARLAEAVAPLEGIGRAPRAFGDIAAHHRDAVARLGGSDEAVFQGEDGAALDEAFAEMREFGGGLMVAPADYGELFEMAIAGRTLWRPAMPGAGVRIFGLLEARLQNVDRMVLGGLTEGTWPPETRSDAWLSRPMRHDLGLDLPERRIGLTAHDFAQALGAGEVILTRAAKVAGAPTLWSRFVQRLKAVAGESQWANATARGERYIALARLLDEPEAVKPALRPEPRPPRDARPTRLSVTEIEHWLRDPYTIYAKHILRIAPLDAVDEAPGHKDRGNVIHGAVGKFTAAFAERLPHDPLAELLALGRLEFAPLEDYPEAKAFWWPRFERIARWFVAWEVARRATLVGTLAEIRGEISIPLGERELRLRGIADRIDRFADSSYAILDYKTGQARTEKQVRTGLAPQLTLEAAILRHGGFQDIPASASVNALGYVLLKGGEPAGKDEPIKFKEGSPDSQAELALRRLTEVAVRFEDEATPYLSLVHPMWSTRYGDYDHLARVKEWALTGGEIDPDAPVVTP